MSTSTPRPPSRTGASSLANTDGNVYAYGASSGRLLWASNAGSYVYSAPAIWRKTVYVGSYDGYFYAFDAATGARRWRTRIGASIHGAPTVLDGLVYFSTCGTCGQRGSRGAAFGPRATYALDARTGRRVWRFFAGHYSPGRRRPGARLRRRVDARVRARGALREALGEEEQAGENEEGEGPDQVARLEDAG